MESKKKKLPKALKNLEDALRRYRSEKSDLNFLTVSKAFETVVEYSWREFKRLVEDQGLEAQAPKIAIKEAARLKLLTEPEVWLICIDARNDSVHDYFGISESEFAELAEKLVALVKKSRINPSE
jgi:uncharacterized protein YutE (UPF0331/DUF86 family)